MVGVLGGLIVSRVFTLPRIIRHTSIFPFPILNAGGRLPYLILQYLITFNFPVSECLPVWNDRKVYDVKFCVL